MPDRAMRPNPGSGYNTGGGKLDLGKLLLGIFGGVEADPNYSASEGPDQGSGEGTKGNFFKARSIFNNADAAEMNAAFREQQLLNNQAEARTNRLADATIPREVYRRTSIDPLDLAKQRAEAGIDVNKAAQLGTQANFSKAGLLNLADLPQAAEMTQQNNLEDVASQQNAARINSATGVNNARLGYDIQQQTVPFSLRHAIAGAQGGALETEGNVANLPAKLLSEREGFRNKPLFDVMRAQAESVKTGREGDTFYDTVLGKPLYQVPYTPIQQLVNQSVQGKLNTSPQGQNQQPNPPTNSPIPPLARPNGFHISDFITDAQGNILGLKPRR